MPEIKRTTCMDFIRRTDIVHGTLNRGVIRQALATSNETSIIELWTRITSTKPSSLTQTNEVGLARVREGRYAFLLPSSIGDYVANKSPCDLSIINCETLFQRGYSLAMPRRSPWLPRLNIVLNRLNSTGWLRDLYRKWWLDKAECSKLMRRSMTSIEHSSAVRLKLVYVFLVFEFVLFVMLK